MYGPDHDIIHDFIEVIRPERISFRHVQPPMHDVNMTMTFVDEAGKTRLTWVMQFESGEEADRVRTIVAQANEENFDRLEAQHRSMDW